MTGGGCAAIAHCRSHGLLITLACKASYQSDELFLKISQIKNAQLNALSVHIMSYKVYTHIIRLTRSDHSAKVSTMTPWRKPCSVTYMMTSKGAICISESLSIWVQTRHYISIVSCSRRWRNSGLTYTQVCGVKPSRRTSWQQLLSTTVRLMTHR